MVLGPSHQVLDFDLCFRATFVDVLVWEVTVQVNSIGVRASLHATAVAFDRVLVPVRIECGCHVNAGVVDQTLNVRIVRVTRQKMVHKVKQYFPTNHFVAMNVGHQSDLWLARLVYTRIIGYLKGVNVLATTGLANGVASGKMGVQERVLQQQLVQQAVVVMLRAQLRQTSSRRR